MPLFRKNKTPVVNTEAKYNNNITNCLEQYLNKALGMRKVYIKTLSDFRKCEIFVDGVADVAGVVQRNEDNVVTHIGLYVGKGMLNAFTPDAVTIITRYENKALDNVLVPF